MLRVSLGADPVVFLRETAVLVSGRDNQGAHACFHGAMRSETIEGDGNPFG
jgi:hypothetical protein